MRRTTVSALLSLSLFACDPPVQTMDDNSLEPIATQSDGAAGDHAGALSLAAGDDGDWSLTVGDWSMQYHSPSRVDLSALEDREVTLSVGEEMGGPVDVALSDSEGLLFASTSSIGNDGTALFGHSVWKAGAVIGDGVKYNDYDEPTDVSFFEVLVADDGGELSVLPGEPTRVVVDGVAYRFTVTAAYQTNLPDELACGAPDVISVELLRTESDPGEIITPPSVRSLLVGSCG